ncbi:KamA family radical SAM protein [Thermodesulfovibrionales bacterium]|nr:KamA family radical SAM protein [Thermodesulfovibrionales bacterium]
MPHHYPHSEKITDHVRYLLKQHNYDIRLNKQFIFDERELLKDESEYEDVASDEAIKCVTGLYHRYPTKVLIFPSENCLGHCRFCFRKHIRKSEILSDQKFREVTKYLKENIQINEVIFSGGDPFTIPLERLLKMIEKIKEIPSIEIIRIHTRVLTYDPSLITDTFIKGLKQYQPTFMVFHINSHLEISEIAKEQVSKLIENGILCFAQTALLHEINDSRQDLSKLFIELIKIRIKPYYLFHPDKVQGASHFYIPLSKGIQLYRSLYNYISGLAMPAYLFNIPGGYGHCIVDLGYFSKIIDNVYKIKTWSNEEIVYNDLLNGSERTNLSKERIVSGHFQIPLSLDTKHFHLEVLGEGHVKEDYETIMSNIKLLKGVFGPYNDWPWKDFTLEENFRDLKWHQGEFINRHSFAYAVRDSESREYLGCVYIYPSFDPRYDAFIVLWIKDLKMHKELDKSLYNSIKNWIHEVWPFENATFPGRDIDWDQLNISNIMKWREYYIRHR